MNTKDAALANSIDAVVIPWPEFGIARRWCLTVLLSVVLCSHMPSPLRAQAPEAKLNEASRRLANLLIANALISVNQGNLTGNYTVLRDLASPGFRQLNSAADLGAIFGNLRQQKIDLSPIVLLSPVITAATTSKETQQLRLQGFYPTEPLQIQFDLTFQLANPGGWMIHGVSIGTASVAAQSRHEEPSTPPVEQPAESIPGAATESQPVARPVSSSRTQPGTSPWRGLQRPANTAPSNQR